MDETAVFFNSLHPTCLLVCHLYHWVITDAEMAFFFGKPPAQFDLNYPLSATTLATLPYARLVGDGYVVVTQDNRILTDSYSSDEVLMRL